MGEHDRGSTVLIQVSAREMPIARSGFDTSDWVVARMYELMEPLGKPELSVGTPVEVRDRFCAGWNSGFEIAAATRHAYRVRRLSDAYVLPVEFDVIDLRPAEVR